MEHGLNPCSISFAKLLIFTNYWIYLIHPMNKPLIYILVAILLLSCQTQQIQQSPANQAIYTQDLQTTSQEWLKNIQTTRRINGDRYADLQQDNEGNNYIASFVMHENRTESAYLVKVNHAGEKQWEVLSSGPANERAYGLSINHQQKQLWMVGLFDGEIHFDDKVAYASGQSVFVAQFDFDGKCMQVIAGEGVAMGLNCVLNEKGDLFVSGNFGSSLKMGKHKIEGTGDDEQFLAKITPESNCEWLIPLGNMHAHRMATDSKGAVYLGGSFKENFEAQSVSLKTADHFDLDGLLLKVSPQGKLLWHQQIGNKGNERYGYRAQESISFIYIDPSDRIFIAGNITGEYKQNGKFLTQKGENLLYIAEYEPTGERKHFIPITKGITLGAITTLTQDLTGNFYLSSIATDTLKFQDTTIHIGLARASFITKYNSDFSQRQWIRHISVESDATFRSVQATPFGVFSAGHYRKRFAFGSLEVTGDSAYHELFLIRINK